MTVTFRAPKCTLCLNVCNTTARVLLALVRRTHPKGHLEGSMSAAQLAERLGKVTPEAVREAYHSHFASRPRLSAEEREEWAAVGLQPIELSDVQGDVEQLLELARQALAQGQRRVSWD